MTRAREVALEPDEGRSSTVLGAAFTRKASTAETGGAYAATMVELDGVELPPHRHHNDEEAIFCVTGAVTVTIGQTAYRGKPGSFFLVPRGTVHNVEQHGAEPAEALLLFSPGETEGLLEEAHNLTDPEQIAAIAEKFGMEVVEGG